MNKDIEDAKDAFKKFSEQFGPDSEYTRILIEVVLEEILKMKKGNKNGK